MSLRRHVRHLPWLVLAFVLFPADAHAYLDPGTGSLIVQSTIAGVAAVAYAVRLYWRRIRSWFRPTRNPDPRES